MTFAITPCGANYGFCQPRKQYRGYRNGRNSFINGFLDARPLFASTNNSQNFFPQVSRTRTIRTNVSETEKDYQLELEVPGYQKSQIDIEFVDRNTVKISGDRARTVEPTLSAAEPSQASESSQVTNSGNEMEIEEDFVHIESEKPSSPKHSVTVEDVDDESETSSVTSSHTVGNADKGKAPETSDTHTNVFDGNSQEKSAAEPKYWIKERKSENFTRIFRFTGSVDHDTVSASLDNGILTIVVPKKIESAWKINVA